MLCHRHYWAEDHRVFASTTTTELSVKGTSDETVQRLMFGVTTIMLKCSTCGELKTVEVLGDARLPAKETR